MEFPLEQALQNLFTIERTDAAGLEKLGGATYLHWLAKELHGTPCDGVDRGTVRQLLDVAKRLWNRCLAEAKSGGGRRPPAALNAAVRLLALTAMSVALQHPELRLFGDDEKKRSASNLCKLAHDFAADLDDVPSAERCCALATDLLQGCSPERSVAIRAQLICARARLALRHDDGELLQPLLADAVELMGPTQSTRESDAEHAVDPQTHVEVASLLVHVARSSVANIQAPTPERCALLVAMFDAVLRICDAGLQHSSAPEHAASSVELARIQTASRLYQAVLWSDMPDTSTMSRALDQLLGLPAPKQREPLVRLCISKVLSRIGRSADATHRTLEVVSECDDFDTCYAAVQLLDQDGQHEARVEALRSMAERGLDRGDVRRWSTLVRDRFVALHGVLHDAERAIAHLDEAMASHQRGEHVLSAEVMSFVHAYLYHEFTCAFERGTNLALAAELAAKAAEWAETGSGKSVAALRMAAWAHLKLGQPTQALRFAREAHSAEPLSPKTNFLVVLAAASLARGGSAGGGDACPLDEAVKALDTLLEATAYDAACLEVLSSTALEEGHVELAVAMLSRWLQRGPMAATDGKLLACLQQLYRVQLGGRDSTTLSLVEVRAIAEHVRVAVSRLCASKADTSQGKEDEVWWATCLAWNLALRAKALGDVQLSLECQSAVLHLADRLQASGRQLRISFESHEQMACTLCSHLDALLQGALPADGAELVSRAAGQAHVHASAALRLLDALQAEEATVARDAPANEGTDDVPNQPKRLKAASAAVDGGEVESSGARDARARMVLVELEALLFQHAFPPKGGGAGCPKSATICQRLEEVAEAQLLRAEQLERIAQRALSLESRVHGMVALSALGYRRACEAYFRALEQQSGEHPASSIDSPAPRSDAFVRLCHCVQRLSERVPDSDACVDADLRAKLSTMLALAELRPPAARPASWPAFLEWLVDRADRWATRAFRSDKLVAAEGWMSRAINMQMALLACVEPSRRAAEEEVLRSLQPKYDKLLGRVAGGGGDPPAFVSPLKPKHFLDATNI